MTLRGRLLPSRPSTLHPILLLHIALKALGSVVEHDLLLQSWECMFGSVVEHDPLPQSW